LQLGCNGSAAAAKCRLQLYLFCIQAPFFGALSGSDSSFRSAWRDTQNAFAGTGKTMLAVQWAIDQLKYGDATKIIVTRPAVSVDEEHGFLPGDLNEKMAPWTRPIFDVIAENYNAKEIEHMVAEGIIETSPLAYMRGRTFKNAVVIADEMQNTTPSQMKMLLTRLGLGSKMVVTGDLQQADRPSNNGLLEFLKLYNNFEDHRYVDICHFTVGDVERHEAVKEILAIYGDS